MNPYQQILADAAGAGEIRPSLSLICTVWQTAVGEELARNTKPCAWSAGILTVEANQSWVPELRASAGLMLSRVNRVLPFQVKRLHFVDGNVLPTIAPAPHLSPPPPESEDFEFVAELPLDLQESAAKITAIIRRKTS